MQEGRRQAEQRRARMFGRPANASRAPASAPNGNGDGAGWLQASAPTNATSQQFDDIFGKPEHDTRAGDDIAAPEQYVPAEDDIAAPPAHCERVEDGIAAPEQYAPAEEHDSAPPPAQYTPAHDIVAALEQPEQPVAD